MVAVVKIGQWTWWRTVVLYSAKMDVIGIQPRLLRIQIRHHTSGYTFA